MSSSSINHVSSGGSPSVIPPVDSASEKQQSCLGKLASKVNNLFYSVIAMIKSCWHESHGVFKIVPPLALLVGGASLTFKKLFSSSPDPQKEIVDVPVVAAPQEEVAAPQEEVAAPQEEAKRDKQTSLCQKVSDSVKTVINPTFVKTVIAPTMAAAAGTLLFYGFVYQLRNLVAPLGDTNSTIVYPNSSVTPLGDINLTTLFPNSATMIRP